MCYEQQRRFSSLNKHLATGRWVQQDKNMHLKTSDLDLSQFKYNGAQAGFYISGRTGGHFLLPLKPSYTLEILPQSLLIHTGAPQKPGFSLLKSNIHILHPQRTFLIKH